MTSEAQSYSPFHDPEIPSLAEALRQFDVLEGETSARKTRVRTAVRTFSRLMERDAGTIPARPNFVMHQFARVNEGPTRLSSKSISNCKSELRYLLETLGISTPRSWFRPLSADWTALRDQINDCDSDRKVSRFCQLSRLAAFCSGLDVAPLQVTDAVIAGYQHALTESGEVDRPVTKVREAVRAWNTIAAEGGTLSPLAPPPHLPRPRWTHEEGAFPESFRQDVEQWLAAQSEVDPEAEEGRVRALRPATIRKYRHEVFKAASALVYAGRPIASVTSMACLVEIDAFKTLMKFLRERQGGKPSKSLLGVAMMLTAIARTKKNLGDAHVARMARLCANYDTEDDHMGKSQERLKAFEDERLLAAILHLPERLLKDAAKDKTSARSRKTLAQVAIALEVELHSPFRVTNLTSLCLESNIQRVIVRGQPNWIIRLPGAETKTHKPLVFELPPEAVRFVEHAMQFYDQPNGFLFPGRGGKQKRSDGLSGQVKAVVEKYLGVPFNTHVMRPLVASMQVKENGFEHARAILGDSTDRVVRRHYTATAEQHLIRKAQKTMQSARTRTAPLAPAGGKRKKAA